MILFYGFFWLFAITGIGCFVYALFLAITAHAAIRKTHAQRRWLLCLVLTHVLEPVLTLLWVMMLFIQQQRFAGIGLIDALVLVVPMLILLLPWTGPDGATLHTRELIGHLRVFGTGRIMFVLMTWLTFITGIVPLILVLIGTIWLMVNLHMVRHDLKALRDEPTSLETRLARVIDAPVPQ